MHSLIFFAPVYNHYNDIKYIEKETEVQYIYF